MTAPEIVQSLIDETPTDDIQRRNKLFQLQTLVEGLGSDLAAYQSYARTAQEESAVLERQVGELTEQLAEARANAKQDQGEVPR